MQDSQNTKEQLFNPSFTERGYIQIYTGNGKGKTTASLGLALRALGRNWNVLIVMFTKGGNDYGELHSFRNLTANIQQHLHIVQAGLDRIVYSDNMEDADNEEVLKGWEIAKQAAQSGDYQLIILDEANIVIDLGIIKVEEMVDFLKNKPKSLEIVITGRNAHPEIIKMAHLVSEINPIKHYWDLGIDARKGIEY